MFSEYELVVAHVVLGNRADSIDPSAASTEAVQRADARYKSDLLMLRDKVDKLIDNERLYSKVLEHVPEKYAAFVRRALYLLLPEPKFTEVVSGDPAWLEVGEDDEWPILMQATSNGVDINICQNGEQYIVMLHDMGKERYSNAFWLK